MVRPAYPMTLPYTVNVQLFDGLSVAVTPLPASVWFFRTGLACLFWGSRKVNKETSVRSPSDRSGKEDDEFQIAASRAISAMVTTHPNHPAGR
jgi:hypothetical protein